MVDSKTGVKVEIKYDEAGEAFYVDKEGNSQPISKEEITNMTEAAKS